MDAALTSTNDAAGAIVPYCLVPPVAELDWTTLDGKVFARALN
jgi:hypothetical protein